MGFAQSDGLTARHRFTPRPQMSISPLFGVVSQEKGGVVGGGWCWWWCGEGGWVVDWGGPSLIRAAGEQVAPWQRTATIANAGWYEGPKC